jgi:hypothetical protein
MDSIENDASNNFSAVAFVSIVYQLGRFLATIGAKGDLISLV